MLMVQTKPQAAVKSSKLKPPPPVPPRPNQNVVAEALAKTRKAVADSKLTKSAKNEKAKTLERTDSAGVSQQNTSPKLNGLARVKSFIRDVISDRSSSDDKKSLGNSRRSSVDAVSAPVAKPAEPRSAGKTIKSCRQALVRSLSTSTKSEQESKGRVLKSSSSFADKNLPLRRAPPPPLSPKPKLREIRHSSASKRNSMEISHKPKGIPCAPPRPSISPPQTPTVPSSSPKTPPVPCSSPPKTPPVPCTSPPKTPSVASSSLTETPIVEAQTLASPLAEAPYATVDEVFDLDNRLGGSPECPETAAPPAAETTETKRNSTSPPPKHISSLERKTSRVTERLISEIIASKNKPKDSNHVIDKGKGPAEDVLLNGCCEGGEGVPSLRDMNNHEMLIYELQTMRSQTRVAAPTCDEAGDDVDQDDNSSSGRASPSPSVDLSDASENSAAPNDHSCDDPLNSRLRKQFRAISSMSLQGLPPLPKSLSGFAEGPLRDDDSVSSGTPERAPPSGDIDAQMALLKKEMASLRRLDLSLLSELWSLNEAMASWRQQLERAPRLRPAPPPPPHYLRT